MNIEKTIMKRIAILLLSVVLAVVTHGQSNNSQSREVYALVRVVYTTTKITAVIDFGDGTPVMAFADEKGGKRKYETIFEPVNSLIKKGWEIDQFSHIIMSGVNTITTYIIKKKVNDESEVKEGMKLIKE